MATVRLRTLGDLALEGSSLRRPTPLLLLAYLALEGAKGRRYLAELFFSRATDPLNRLSVTLSRLRKTVSGAVEADRIRVGTPLGCDATEFLDALERGEAEAALPLYQGSFLEGTPLHEPSVELEEWVFGTRDFLTGRAVDAHLAIAEAAAADGDFAVGARQAERAYRLAAGSGLEPHALARVLTLLISGRSSLAVALADEAAAFGIEPPAGPSEARRALRPERATAPQPPRSTLPPPATSFLGRRRELDALGAMLRDPDRRLITLTGPAGIGKTRLATEAARHEQRAGRFADGVVFVALDTVDGVSAIPDRLAEAVGVEARGDDALPRVARRLRTASTLLLLDNFEQLLAGAPLLSELLAACPELRLLATSRERLDLPEEWVVPVEGLAVAEADRGADREALSDAARLFVQRAAQVRPEVRLDDAVRRDIDRLCRLVGGSPLALELAAAWVRALSPGEIADEIRGNLDLLSTTSRSIPERHRSLRSAFDTSWRRLDPGAQALLRRLAVFRDGFRRDAAAAVAGATLPALAALVDRSLLRRDPGGRFDLHPLLQQYLAAKLGEHPAERDDTLRRHADHYLERFRVLGKELVYGDSPRANAALLGAFANIRLAWDWAVAERKLDALEHGALTLRNAFERWGRWREGAALLAGAGAALDERRDEHRLALQRIALGGASLHRLLGELETADALAERSLRLARAVDDERGRLASLNTLGLIQFQRGAFDAAEGYFAEALALAEISGNDRGRAAFLGNLGLVAKAAGRYPLAIERYREALELNRRLGNDYGAVHVLGHLGELHRLDGDPEAATEVLAEGRALAEEVGVTAALPYLDDHLARVRLVQGDYRGALERIAEGLRLARANDDRRVEIGLLATRAEVALAEDDLDEAGRCLLQGLRLARGTGSLAEGIVLLPSLGVVLAKRGRPAEAAALWRWVIGDPRADQASRDRARDALDRFTPGRAAAGLASLPEGDDEASRLVRDLLGAEP